MIFTLSNEQYEKMLAIIIEYKIEYNTIQYYTRVCL